jgi:alpha-glucosidase
MQVGMFSPFCRNHRGFFTVAGEPWAYGEETEAISKNFIEFRYRMMPYLYSSFYEAAQTGMPVARSLSINYPYDEKVFDNTYQYQFLFGSSMMVVPVTSEEKSKKIYLPSGEWYNVYTDEKITGKKEWKEEVPLYQLPLYIKASAIIPMQTVVQSTKEKPLDTIYIHVYNGKEKNSFIYYEDEGDGFGYKNGKYCKRNIVFDPLSKQINVEQQVGNYTSGFKKIQFILHGFDNEIKNITINGTSVAAQPCSSKLLDGLQGLQDYYDPAYFSSLRNAAPAMKQQTIITNNISSAIHIQW